VGRIRGRRVGVVLDGSAADVVVVIEDAESNLFILN
jgi:hypothetical protein